MCGLIFTMTLTFKWNVLAQGNTAIKHYLQLITATFLMRRGVHYNDFFCIFKICN